VTLCDNNSHWVNTRTNQKAAHQHQADKSGLRFIDSSGVVRAQDSTSRLKRIFTNYNSA